MLRLQGRALVEVARLDGLTNHQIGEAVIRGGLRDCGAGPELVLADPAWTRAMGVTLDGGRLRAVDLGPITGTAGLDRALACP